MSRGVILDALQIGTLSLATLTSFLANFLLLGASLHRKLEITTPEDLLIAATAVADILVAAIIPLNVVADFELLGNGRTMTCVLANSPILSFPCLALFMLIALTIERCINIFMPLRAMVIITCRRVIIVILCVFLYGTVLTLLLPLVGHNIQIRQDVDSNMTDCNFVAVATAPLAAFLLLGNIIPGMLVLVCLNGAIFYTAGKHLHQIASLHQSNLTAVRKEKIADYKRQKTLNNAVVFVCQLYVLSYLPGTIAICIDFQGFGIHIVEEWQAPFILYAIGMFMASLNTVFFPVILIKNNSQYLQWVRQRVLRQTPQNEGLNHGHLESRHRDISRNETISQTAAVEHTDGHRVDKNTTINTPALF